MILDLALQDALRTLETSGQDAAPACHLGEDDKAFRVRLAVPGWQPDEMSLEMESDMLTIRGARSFDTFLRLVKLPAFVNAEKGRAVHYNGVLTISFPNRPEAKARRILIEVT